MFLALGSLRGRSLSLERVGFLEDSSVLVLSGALSFTSSSASPWTVPLVETECLSWASSSTSFAVCLFRFLAVASLASSCYYKKIYAFYLIGWWENLFRLSGMFWVKFLKWHVLLSSFESFCRHSLVCTGDITPRYKLIFWIGWLSYMGHNRNYKVRIYIRTHVRTWNLLRFFSSAFFLSASFWARSSSAGLKPGCTSAMIPTQCCITGSFVHNSCIWTCR